VRSVFEIAILACSIVGMMSAAHLATIQVRSRVVSALDVTKTVTGSLALSGGALFLFRPTNIFVLWFCLQAPFAIAIFSAFLLAKRRDRAVENSLDDVLSRLMMRMKQGRSLGVALEMIAAETSPSIRPRWIEIARSVSFSPQENESATSKVELKSVRLIEIVREFRRIDLLTRSQLVEIERWRHRVRTERIFRRRSVQAMGQVRAQSIILTAIYVLLSIFSVVAFGWNAVFGSLQLSLPMFLCGLFLIWRSGRSVKWTI
jgi:Flp pilus assembly protein TadB